MSEKEPNHANTIVTTGLIAAGAIAGGPMGAALGAFVGATISAIGQAGQANAEIEPLDNIKKVEFEQDD
jgi:hypothetical protein